VWQELDAEGFAQRIANALLRPVKVISIPNPEKKDAFRLWLSYGKNWQALRDVVKELLESCDEIFTPRQPDPVATTTTTVLRYTNAMWKPLR